MSKWLPIWVLAGLFGWWLGGQIYDLRIVQRRAYCVQQLELLQKVYPNRVIVCLP